MCGWETQQGRHVVTVTLSTAQRTQTQHLPPTAKSPIRTALLHCYLALSRAMGDAMQAGMDGSSSGGTRRQGSECGAGWRGPRGSVWPTGSALIPPGNKRWQPQMLLSEWDQSICLLQINVNDLTLRVTNLPAFYSPEWGMARHSGQGECSGNTAWLGVLCSWDWCSTN